MGVHKIQILIRDLLKEFLQKIFGEEMGGGQGDPDPLMKRPPDDEKVVGRKKSSHNPQIRFDS